MAYKDSDNQIVVVEYDGDHHFRNSLQIKRDFEKDEPVKGLGFKVIRIPYWVQLTVQTLNHYFGISAEIVQGFPHGFITTVIFPASFCELGVERLHNELESLPKKVKEEGITSLKKQIDKQGLQYVLPKKLDYLVEN
jgi:hypothetical protein